ncbi:MAG: ATP-binding protein [Mariprofundaceae bacterium]
MPLDEGYYTLLDHLFAGAMLVDSSYKIQHWNRQLVQWSGLASEDVINTPLKAHFPHLMQAKYKSRFDQVLAHGTPAVFSAQIHKYLIPLQLSKGGHRIHQSSVTQVFIGSHKEPLLLFLFQDQTDSFYRSRELRKLNAQLEAELEHSTHVDLRNQALLEAIRQAGEAIVILGKEGEVEYCNRLFAESNGYDEGAPPDREVIFSNFSSDDEQWPTVMWESVDAGECWQGRIHARREDSSVFPAAITLAPVTDVDGEQARLIMIQEDLTEQVKIEEKLLQVRKNDALSTLVGGIAHDFNNILSGMIGNLYLAKRDVSALPKVKERLERVESLASKSAEMIKQMLSFSRLARVEKSEFPLDSFLKEFMKKMIGELSNQGVTLSYLIEPREYLLHGDMSQIQQMMEHLINNAVDAVSQRMCGEIKVSLSIEGADVAEKLQKKHRELAEPPFIHISVADNGCGIAPEDLEKVFDPFFSTKLSHSGMGLAAVSGCVSSHHGVIEVSCDPNEEGSCFDIWLPYKQ